MHMPTMQIYPNTHILTFPNTQKHTHWHKHIYTAPDIQVDVHSCIPSSKNMFGVHIYACTHIYTHINIHAGMNKHIYAYIHMHSNVCISVHSQAHFYMQNHKDINLSYTHIHIQNQAQQ